MAASEPQARYHLGRCRVVRNYLGNNLLHHAACSGQLQQLCNCCCGDAAAPLAFRYAIVNFNAALGWRGFEAATANHQLAWADNQEGDAPERGRALFELIQGPGYGLGVRQRPTCHLKVANLQRLRRGKATKVGHIEVDEFNSILPPLRHSFFRDLTPE